MDQSTDVTRPTVQTPSSASDNGPPAKHNVPLMRFISARLNVSQTLYTHRKTQEKRTLVQEKYET